MPDPFDVVVIGGGPQRARRRRPPREAGRACHRARAPTQVGGAAITERPWGPEFNVTPLSYVVSLMPPDRDARARARPPRLPRVPAGRVLRAARDGRASQLHDPPGEHRPVLGDAMPTRTPGGKRGSAGWPTCSRRSSRDASAPRIAPSARPRRPGAARVDGSPAGRARRRRRHPPVHDEHRRPARGPVRVAADARRPLGERRHRHVGRARSAGTAYVMAHHQIGDVGDGETRYVGLPRGRDGRWSPTRSRARRSRSAPRSAPTSRRAHRRRDGERAASCSSRARSSGPTS